MTDLITYVTRLPASACEDHDFAGCCTQDCAWLTGTMMGDGYVEPGQYTDFLGGVWSHDVSGCFGGKPMPKERACYDPVNKAVVLVADHPKDCWCGAEDCPAAE